MAIKLSKDNPFNNFKNDKNATIYSMNWFNKTIDKLLKNPYKNKEERVKDTLGSSAGGIQVGELVLMTYDPKHKATLPIYDTFPLVFPIRKLPTGFIGLNIHYLEPSARVAMLGILMENHLSSNTLSKSSKLRMSWNVINAFANLEPLKDTVHQYLYTHVRSKFVKIDPDNWVTAARLPLENFVRKQQ